MDPQGNQVSAAIQSIFVHPTNPKVVFIGTVGGGLWKTDDIDRNELVDPYSPSKAQAPDISNVNLIRDTGGNLTKGKTYRYKIVFVDSTGLESNASEFKGMTLEGDQNKITLENLPVGLC